MFCFHFYLVVALSAACLVGTAADEPQYQGISRGFAIAIKRHEPFVLFRTAMGIQLLSGNNTCYNNRTSLYYASATELLYMGYSTEDNYLLTLDSVTLCRRNLFKSEWNKVIGPNYKKECESKTVQANIFALSITRHILYALGGDGSLSAVTLRNTKCTINTNALYDGADLLHVTNFAKGDDHVLVGISTKRIIHVLTIGGDPGYQFNLTDGQKLLAIESDQWDNYFLLVQDDFGAKVLRFKHRLEKSGTVVVDQADYKAVAFSVSKHVLAVLLTQDHITFWLHLKANAENMTESSPSTIYKCAGSPDLRGLLVVDQQVQPSRDICSYKSICASTFEGKFCGRKALFYFPTETRINETDVESELMHKVVLTGAVAFICLVLLALFQQINMQSG